MLLFKKFPDFWHHRERMIGAEGQQFIFRRKWKQLAIMLCLFTLTPLVVSTVLFYQSNRNRAVKELLQETVVLAKDYALDMSMFFQQYISALQGVGALYDFKMLSHENSLQTILHALKKTDNRFIDLIVLNGDGHLLSSTIGRGNSLSDHFINWAKDMHHAPFNVGVFKLKDKNSFFVGIRLQTDNNDTFYLLGLLDNAEVSRFLSQLKVGVVKDIFITDDNGFLLTPSVYFMETGQVEVFTDPALLSNSVIMQNPLAEDRQSIFIGAAKVKNANLKVGIVLTEHTLEKFLGWFYRHIIGLVLLSGIFLAVAVLGLVTFVVDKLYRADQRRHQYLQQVEQTDKLASIGRLAAGVAHEINNPLAIINEKAGLLKDLFTFVKEYKEDERLLTTVESIISTVERAGTITHRLLSFARKMDTSVASLNIKDVIRDVLDFIQKEAEYKGISIDVDVADDVRTIVSDRGKLQQILLNLVNNAVAAMDHGGRLDISVRNLRGEEAILLTVQDNGCGIPLEHHKKVFEPFFSTKQKSGGTGLGLAITYGLVRDLRGTLEMESVVEEGTTFTITLPYVIRAEEI